MEPLISVIIPVYNTEACLERCLDSILNNTYQNLEVICVDDGSRDHSLMILREYEKRDSRVVVIAKENGGVSTARNVGLDRMTGEFVTFVDSDDLVHPEYFELLAAAQTDTDADITVCSYTRVSDSDFPISFGSCTYSADNNRFPDTLAFFKDGYLRSYVWGKLIRAALVNKLRFLTDFTYGEDAVFVAALWENNPEITCCVTEWPLYYYYERSGSLVDRVKGSERIKIASYFFMKAKQSKRNEEIYLVQSEFRVRWYMNYYRNVVHDPLTVKACLRLMRSKLPLIWKTSLLSRRQKERFTYYCLFSKKRHC